jgi:hypothetical protein
MITSAAPPLPALIACVDSGEDVLLLLRDCMVDAGYRAVTFASPIRYGAQPVIDFVTYLVPDLAIFAVSPPYERSWAEFLRLRRDVPETPCLAVTTHKSALERLVGPTETLEVLATAADLMSLVAAVRTLVPGPDGPRAAAPALTQDADAT